MIHSKISGADREIVTFLFENIVIPVQTLFVDLENQIRDLCVKFMKIKKKFPPIWR